MAHRQGHRRGGSEQRGRRGEEQEREGWRGDGENGGQSEWSEGMQGQQREGEWSGGGPGDRGQGLYGGQRSGSAQGEYSQREWGQREYGPGQQYEGEQPWGGEAPWGGQRSYGGGRGSSQGEYGRGQRYGGAYGGGQYGRGEGQGEYGRGWGQGEYAAGRYTQGYGESSGQQYGQRGMGQRSMRPGGFGGDMSGMSRMGMAGRFAGRGPKGYRRSDERIKEDVSEQLTQDPDIDPGEVEIKVSSGEVTITGTVDSREAKRMIEDLVESASGVKEVHNQLRVKQQGSRRDEESESGSDGGSRSETTQSRSSRS